MDKKEEIKKDIKRFSSISAILGTDGGKLLVSSLQKDIISSIDELIGKYKTSTHTEIIANCARLSERLTLLRTLNRAKKNKKLATEELSFVLSEEE